MIERLRTASLVAAALALSACSVFGDDEEELEPLELMPIETTLTVKRLWQVKLGGGAEFLRVALRPAGDGNRIYAASRDGNVVALNPETGKQNSISCCRPGQVLARTWWWSVPRTAC